MQKYFDTVATFEWHEIDGKTLDITVISEGELTGVYGKDRETGILYVLAEKLG